MEMDTWPGQVVSLLTKEEKHCGFGFFTVIKGRWCVVTASHVLKRCKEGYLYTPKAQLALKGDLAFQYTGDIVGVWAKESWANILGCKKLEIDFTPSTGSVVKTYGYVNGRMQQSEGNISGIDRALKFKHTSSTLNGWSGTPILCGAKKVIGIHLESDAMGYNYGGSLDLLVKNREADWKSDYEDDRRLFNEFAELESEDEDELWWMDGEGSARVKRGRKHWAVAGRWVDEYTPVTSDLARPLTGSWADDLEESKGRMYEHFQGGKGKAPETPSASSSGTGSGNERKKRKTKKNKKSSKSKSVEENSNTSVNSSEPSTEDPKGTANPPEQKSESGSLSETSTGQDATVGAQGNPSGFTLGGLGTGKSPQKNNGQKSSTRLSPVEIIQKLASLSGVQQRTVKQEREFQWLLAISRSPSNQVKA
jgi:hypothetical protein